MAKTVAEMRTKLEKIKKRVVSWQLFYMEVGQDLDAPIQIQLKAWHMECIEGKWQKRIEKIQEIVEFLELKQEQDEFWNDSGDRKINPDFINPPKMYNRGI